MQLNKTLRMIWEEPIDPILVTLFAVAGILLLLLLIKVSI